MTRIIGHVVVKNESDNWLESCLSWNLSGFDELHVYDDRSTDSTNEIASRFTDNITVRTDPCEFMENESRFRQVAWDDMSEKLSLTKDDWVFCFDADEFLVAHEKYNDLKELLEFLVDFAERTKNKSVSFMRREVWDAEGLPIRIRTDGWWKASWRPQLVKWQKGGKFKNVKLGCGSVPDYGLKGSLSNIYVCNVLHFGYAIKGAAQRKHSLYSSVSDNTHSKRHIESIIQVPKLEFYEGELPDFWRGIK